VQKNIFSKKKRAKNINGQIFINLKIILLFKL